MRAKTPSFASRSAFQVAAASAETKSARARTTAASLDAYRLRRLSAHASPAGNRSSPGFTSARFTGIASTTPSTETAPIQSARAVPDGPGEPTTPSRCGIASAGIALASPDAE